jgi:5-methylcytosine-specific restriction protein A
MGLGDLTDRGAVLSAIEEFDRLGPDDFLQRHGFGPARSYFVLWNGQRYDSKAIAGVAHNIQRPDLPALTGATSTFSGGEATVARKLRELGFEVERLTEGRNPPWAFDELILALDLYLDAGMLDDTDQRVVELSQLLNRLPIHTVRPDRDRFRNPNGVALKLANFASIDPEYHGVGMSRVGQRDREVWERFASARDELRNLASRIADTDNEFPMTTEEDEDGVQEGRLIYRQHRARERDRRIVKRKKDQILASGRRVTCEACGFDFETTYGELGRGYIECHHVVPLSQSGSTTTRLRDLALVCSNCHRMIHRQEPWPTVTEMRLILER